MYNLNGLAPELKTALEHAQGAVKLPVSENGKKLETKKTDKGFYVRIGEDKAEIGYAKTADFLRGALYLACGKEVSQTNAFDDLGVMVDCSRNAVPKVETVKKFVSFLASLGYTYVYLYTEDTYELKDNPYFGYLRGRYTKAEIKEMDDFCASVGVELRPCIQTLAHINQITRYKSYEDIIDCNDILLCGEEKTYRLIDDMFRTLAENFTSRKVNIGMDEAHMLGLGRYLDRHGYCDRADIMLEHLKKVLAIAEKYGFTCAMWSDMFFRLFSGGHYGEIKNVPQAVLDKIPSNVELIYWDYYATDYSYYDKMVKSHQKMSGNIGFAGGAWKWTGFTPHNDFSLRTMKLSVKACRENGVKDYFVTSWGDNGGEGMLNSVLPSFYYTAMAAYGDGKNKDVFRHMTGISFDDFMKLDLPNKAADIRNQHNNSSRVFLYDDLLFGIFDCAIGGDFAEKYRSFRRRLSRLAAGEYGYLFGYMAALCEVLAYKTDLSVKIKQAYKEGDKAAVRAYMDGDMKKLIAAVRKFYKAFAKAWETENKPFGFEVQDHRLGGLEARLKAIEKKLCDYADGAVETVPELDEKHLPCDYVCGADLEKMLFVNWAANISTGIV